MPGIDLFASVLAVKHLRAREQRTVSFPYIDSIIGEWGGPLAEVHYQRGGQGQKPQKAYFDPGRTPEPETWLVEKLGPLRFCYTVHQADPVEAADQAGQLEVTPSPGPATLPAAAVVASTYSPPPARAPPSTLESVV